MRYKYDNQIENIILELAIFDEKNYYTKLNNICIYYYYSLYLTDTINFQNNKYYKKARTMLEEICKNVNIYDIPLGSSCGYVHLAYLARALNHDNTFDNLINKLETLIIYYSTKIINEFNWKHLGMNHYYYDMLFGLCSVAHYFYYYNKNQTVRLKITKWLLDVFTYKKTPLLNGFFITKENTYNNNFKKNYANGYIDLGLSHGLAGILTILTEAYEDKLAIPNLKLVIKDLIQQYLNNRSTNNNYIDFPSISFQNNNQIFYDYDNRYSWCYGSLGISRALHYAINTLYRKSPISAILNNNIIQLTKNNLSVYNYSSPIFCHGYAGLYHMLNLYQFNNNNHHLELYIKKLEKKIWEYYSIDSNKFIIEEFEILPDQIIIENNIVDGIGSILIPLMINKLKKDVGFFSKILFIAEKGDKTNEKQI